ncbi:hypothetical protein [Cellulosimicrobium cellulans]|uniref:hypothetical protein n=1 Tax=Cellulosimicrobium cellulans TaxID=1710 RepID=UPI001EDC8C25|nr:hypothetical protein [Cellulosimicrobium cellulans]MDF9878634.1 hypothetical protein [Cellulosimicrobium cellulans]UKJ63150.1 hypothetical protein H1Q78_15890 [Cellulosimicrobium cellulans]
MHRDVHRIIVPTVFGYATLVRAGDTHPLGLAVTSDDDAHLLGGTTQRIDTVLPPDITADELLDFHARLRLRPGHRRRPRTAAAAVSRRQMLNHAVDVRTTAALAVHRLCPAPAPRDVVFAALVRSMRRADDAHLTKEKEALARQLVWCAIYAARDHHLAQVLHAATALHHLILDQRASTTDALDQA